MKQQKMASTEPANPPARNIPRVRPPTIAQLRLLKILATGESAVNADYQSHVTPGRPSRVENSLAIMAARVWVDWSDAVSDVTITIAGRLVLAQEKDRAP